MEWSETEYIGIKLSFHSMDCRGTKQISHFILLGPGKK